MGVVAGGCMVSGDEVMCCKLGTDVNEGCCPDQMLGLRSHGDRRGVGGTTLTRVGPPAWVLRRGWGDHHDQGGACSLGTKAGWGDRHDQVGGLQPGDRGGVGGLGQQGRWGLASAVRRRAAPRVEKEVARYGRAPFASKTTGAPTLNPSRAPRLMSHSRGNFICPRWWLVGRCLCDLFLQKNASSSLRNISEGCRMLVKISKIVNIVTGWVRHVICQAPQKGEKEREGMLGSEGPLKDFLLSEANHDCEGWRGKKAFNLIYLPDIPYILS